MDEELVLEEFRNILRKLNNEFLKEQITHYLLCKIKSVINRELKHLYVCDFITEVPEVNIDVDTYTHVLTINTTPPLYNIINRSKQS